jgi:hypothetical protein
MNARYAENKWYSILIDIGAAKRSTTGFNQYFVYQELFNIPLNISDEYKVAIRFGIGITTTLGAIHVNMSLDVVDFYVANTDTPFLLSLENIDRLKVYYNNVNDKVVLQTTGNEIPIIYRFGHR